MLYNWLYPLRDQWFIFNLFRYITFRAAGAMVTALFISLILGPFLIRCLKKFAFEEKIRKGDVFPLYELHKGKEGTPTMGGLLILIAIVVSSFLWANFDTRSIGLVLFSTVSLGIIGFIDDYLKVKKMSAGLSAAAKFIGQFVIGLLIGIYLFKFPLITQYASKLNIPFFKDLWFQLGVFYVLFVALVIVSTSNAVNLTDGLDGLAIGCIIIAALAFTGIAYVCGNFRFADYLNIAYVPGAGELAVFCASLIGAGLGFLWYNCHPAQVFMGDTGSLALGGALGTVAVIIKQELVLIIVGGIFILEAFSVILQVIYFRFTKKRLFLIAPLHHHFEAQGWPESKIIIRLWILAAIFALLSLSTLKIR